MWKITVSKKKITREIVQKQKVTRMDFSNFSKPERKKLFSFGMIQMLKGKNMEKTKTLLRKSLEVIVTYKMEIQRELCCLIMIKRAMEKNSKKYQRIWTWNFSKLIFEPYGENCSYQ